MSLLSNLQLMSQYNQWMNQKVYQVVDQLEEDELKCDLGAFFGSILATLNHIYVADIIWLKRFSSHEIAYQSLKGLPELSSYTALNQIVSSDLATLIQLRQKLDTIIIDWCQEIESEDLATHLEYFDTKGNAYCKNFGQLIHHFFNHQTHHRGQVSTLITQQGLDIGVTDLLKIIPNC